MIKPLLSFNSRCFQYILRKKKLTFWEISIGVNFICFLRNYEKFDFDLENGGSTYTRVNTVFDLNI